ncbi:MAG TPA: hypothetical protein PKC18_05135 [Lacipirellulaceae bacterium]|nr:hypothetical protein [Lacipirellulaceae bacterium]
MFKGSHSAEKVQVTKDVEFCSEHNPMVETVVVGADGGLKNVFVYLYVARGKQVEIAPSYSTNDLEPRVLDNLHCRFEPHALTVWTSEPFEIHNSDPIGHNTNAQMLAANTRFNETVPQGSPIKKSFSKSEPRPAMISCSIHPWMNAYLLIRDNPYMAVSGDDGSFEIKDVPAGAQEFIIWHEAVGFVRNLKIGSGKTDRKGQVELKVPAGDELDLGDVEVTPDLIGL